MNLSELKQFCSRDPCRPNLYSPCSRGEWTYATDGHIAVRVPRIEVTIDTPKYYPPIETLPFADAETIFTPAPKIAIPEIGSRECERCSGRGHQHDCPDCKCECEGCGGTGQGYERASVGIGTAVFDAKYIALILRLPNIQFASPPKEIEPMAFRFNGGDGVLMPTHGPYAIHIQIAEAA